MPELSGIYDSAPIQPVAKIKENLSIWTRAKWSHFQIVFIEPFPRSSQTQVDAVNAAGATTVAANGTIAKQNVAILQLSEFEFLHLRWEPIDDVEGVLWEQASSGRFVTRGTHSRVDIRTRFRDPYLATTTFFILGMDRDMQLEVRNPLPVAQPAARFQFWGFRYLLEEHTEAKAKAIDAGSVQTSWLPAEARAS